MKSPSGSAGQPLLLQHTGRRVQWWTLTRGFPLPLAVRSSLNPPSTPLALAVSFFGTEEEKGIKKKNGGRVLESERGRQNREQERCCPPSTGFQCHPDQFPVRVQACGVSFNITPPHSYSTVYSSCKMLKEGRPLPPHFSYEWWRRMRLRDDALFYFSE